MVTVDRIHGRNDPGRINAGRNPAPGRPGPDPVRTGPIRVGRAPTRAALHRALPGTTPTRAALHRALPGTTPSRASWDAEFYTYPPARIGGHITLQSGARDRARPTRIVPVRTGSDGRSDGRTGRSARDDPVPGLLGSRILHLSTGPHRGHIALQSGARDGGPSRAPLYRRCLVNYFDECKSRASRAHAVRHVKGV